MTLLIRLSATDRPHSTHTQPDSGGTTSSRQETPWVPWQPMENNGTGMLHITTGNNYFICCEVVVFSPKSLAIIFSLSFSFSPSLTLSISLSPFISNLCVSLSLCNHILYTIGSQSNLMHRYSLIKLIWRDPLLQSVLNSFMPPYQNTHTYTYSCSTSPFRYVLVGSSAISRNATQFAKCYS